MEEIQTGELVDKILKDKKITRYKLAVDSKRPYISICNSIKNNTFQTSKLIGVLNTLEADLIVSHNGIEYKLINK